MRRPAPGRPTPAPTGGYVRLDSGRDPFSVVFAITGTTTYEDATAAYTGHEVWVYGDGTVVEVQNGHVLTASQPGVPLDGTEFAAGDLALARLGPGASGRVWELVPIGDPVGGSGPDEEDACRGPLAGLRTYECVEFVIVSNGSAVDDATFGGAWDATESGWLADEVVTTGDGDTRLILARSAGRYYLRLEGETETWEGYDVGCVGGYLEFAADADPTADDGDGTISGSGNPPDDCADNTFRVRVKCGSCDLTFAGCDVPAFTVPRALCMAVIWDETKTPTDCGECNTTAVITYGVHTIDCTDYGGTGTGYFTGWFNPAVATTEACQDLYTGTGATNWAPGATFDMGMRISGTGADIVFEPRFSGLPTGTVCTSTESAVIQGGGCGAVASGDITLDPFLVDANTTVSVSQVFSPNTSCKTPTTLTHGYRIIVGPVPAGGCTAANMLAEAVVCNAPACPDGAADQYTFTTSGGTLAYADANGAWTVTHAGGDEWVGVLGAWTATLDADAGTLTLDGPGAVEIVYELFSGTFCCESSVWKKFSSNDGGGGGVTPGDITTTPVGGCDGCP